ncbi:insulin-like growth factor-binding protein complex acid labile subunit isoform X3 [Apis laboriosa]|uniref:insulin-like growth factor-binding protein complex acid labile subunit isoform X3 n=1 Tax=Apis laboriosa TaxID=183418 RepID=UPI001CC3D3D0|nr:insulin-like growth factor-binding protein complex acid labile subunit isoform X3 [Apis laboriosa]
MSHHPREKSKITRLDLSGNAVASIPGDEINRLVELEILNLAGNKITSFPDNVSSLKSLRELDLSGNVIKGTSDIRSLGQLPSLKVLYLSRNPLSELDGLISRSLEALDAGQCGIRVLSNSSLDGLPQLTMLTLVGNPLTTIHDTWSPKLKWLDVSDCQLNYLGPDTLYGFPELDELLLSNNPTLVYSTRNSTLTHPKLRKLDASRCNLDRPGLHGFPLLTHARLARNAIRILPDRIFARNRQLGFLYLSGNRLETLTAGTFEGLVKLQTLDLSANNLEKIHPYTFHENIELKTLNLSYNAFYELPKFTSAVITLDASSNLINRLNENLFVNMPRLKSIDLSDNRIQKIPFGLKSTTLRNFDLRANRIVELANDTFLQLPQLRSIDLSGNRLTEVADPEIFRNNPNLDIIYLEDNPWHCDCDKLFAMYNYLTEPPKIFKQILICQSPSNVSGYSWLIACFDEWHKPLDYNKDRSWGFAIIVILSLTILFGSFVSIRHMMKIRRRAIEQRRRLENLSLLRQTRNQTQVTTVQEIVEHRPEPRINPLELIEPPSYEEAVQMPRLTQSLDNLDNISARTCSVGSVDNIRSKQRRGRRSKRIQSENDLLRREERRQERLRRERNNSVDNNETSLPSSQRNSRVYATRRARRQSVISDSMESGSGRIRAKPQTPRTRKRRQKSTVYTDNDSTDDEYSKIVDLNKWIKEFPREPRNRFGESIIESDFSTD